jgi:hypothetical protein
MNRGFIGALCLSVAFAFLAGCGGSQPPIGAPGAMPQSRAIEQQHASQGKSWMLPEAKSSTLIYVSAALKKEVRIFSYPRLKFVGRLRGFDEHEPLGLCSDKAGNVFVVTPISTSESNIYEYTHGGTDPVAVLADPGDAASCSVDPTTENLAVTNTSTYGSQDGKIAIFAGAQGTPVMYGDSEIGSFLFCAYDDSGNLFADDYPGSNIIGELPAGENTFTNLTLDQAVVPGSLQWVNHALVAAGVVDSRQGEQPIYQIAINGSTGNVSGPILLWSHGDENPGSVQYWVYENAIIGPGLKGHGDLDLVNLWRYPQGGHPRTTRASGAGNVGVTVSLAPHR